MHISQAKNSNPFGQLISPYNAIFKVGNNLIKIRRGSFSALSRAYIYNPLDAESKFCLDVGQFSEFNRDCQVHIGGEHILDGNIVNNFEDSPHLKQYLINEGVKTNSVSKGAINIGNSVILSSRTTILSGAKVGDNSIVAAGAIVNSTHTSNEILGGIPARRLKKLSPHKINWWDLSIENIIEYKKSGEVKNPKINHLNNFYFSFISQIDINGKINKFDLNGFYLEDKFYDGKHFNKTHFDYFRQVQAKSENVVISDEIFNDLLNLP